MRTDSPQTAREATAASNSESHSARRLFGLAGALTAVWLIVLLSLSITTANPATLNLDQVLESTDVLTAVVENPQTGTVRVQKTWKEEVTETELVLANLGLTGAAAGKLILIPVVKRGRIWVVTPTKLPGNPPLVYPATAKTARQLQGILQTGRLP